MKILDIDQRSDAWYAWRRQGLTASVAAAVLGYDDHKTKWRVWAEYTGRIESEDLSRNPNIVRGQRFEDAVRQRYEEKHDDIVLPCCVEWDEDPIFKASLDGLNLANEPVELKAPSLSVFQSIRQYGRASEPYLRYWIQVQHQMLCTGSDHGWLCFLCMDAPEGEDYMEFRIDRDESFLEELIADSRKFWMMVEKKKEPAKDPERDIYIPEGTQQLDAWFSATTEWKRLDRKASTLKERLSELEAQKKRQESILADLMGEYRSAYAYGLTVTRYTRKGSIAYKRIVEEKLDLSDTEIEQYRGAPPDPILRITEKAPSAEVIEREAYLREKSHEEKLTRIEEAFPLANW